MFLLILTATLWGCGEPAAKADGPPEFITVEVTNNTDLEGVGCQLRFYVLGDEQGVRDFPEEINPGETTAFEDLEIPQIRYGVFTTENSLRLTVSCGTTSAEEESKKFPPEDTDCLLQEAGVFCEPW